MINWDQVERLQRVREQGDVAEALEGLRALMSDAETSEEIGALKLQQSLCLDELGMESQALQAALESVSVLPRSSSLRVFPELSLAVLFEQSGDFNRAADLLQAAILRLRELQEDELLRSAQLRLLAVLIAQGEFAGARDQLKRLKAESLTEKECAELNYREGVIHASAKEDDLAMHCFAAALAQQDLDDELRARALFRSAEIRFRWKDFRGAHAQFQSARALQKLSRDELESLDAWIKITDEKLQTGSAQR